MRKLAYFLSLLLISFCAQAQERTVTGKIINQQTGEAIVDATVTVKGTSVVSRSAADGSFSISIPNPNAVLVITHTGMEAQEIKVGSKSDFSIALVQSNVAMTEVIVTGYTSERKKDITGAVSVVNMKEIASIPTGNVMTALQGRVPGVNITTNGTPGGTGTDVSIRGITTVNNNSPLYVIDGVQTRNSPSTILNANDIESIQVLKDAASASIYGTQASNGVIIITTKKAGRNQLRIDFDAQLTAQRFRSGIPLLNAQQWGEAYWQAYQNDGIPPRHDQYGSGPTPVIPEFIDLGKTIRAGNTNWADEVYGPSFQQ